jgi:hypothetical protein
MQNQAAIPGRRFRSVTRDRSPADGRSINLARRQFTLAFGRFSAASPEAPPYLPSPTMSLVCFMTRT